MPTWFQNVVIDGRGVALCLLDPDWSLRPKITHSFATTIDEANTGIEAREPERDVMQLSVEYRYTFGPAQAQQFLDAIRDLQGARLALPLAPDILPRDVYESERIYAAQRWVNFDPVSGAYSLNADGGHPFSAGLIVGRLASRPRITGLTDLHGTVTIKVAHDAPWSCRIEPHTLSMPAWTFDPDWSTDVEDTTTTKLKQHKLGRGGESGLDYPDSPAKRVQACGFAFKDREEIRKALTFFSVRRGAHEAFTVPETFRPGWDLVDGHEPILEARFAGDDLTLQYTTQETAKTELSFQQVLLLGESEPTQERPPRANLYLIWWDGSDNVMAWTDWERPLTSDGITYEPKIVEHRAEAEDLRPGTSDWEFAVEDFDGNPLRAFSLWGIERRLRIEIRYCNPDLPETATMLFAGEFSTTPSKGDFYTAKIVLLGGALKREIPNFFCQTNCNHILYDDLCGVNPEAHKVTGTLAAIADTVIDITCGSAAADDWFTSGYIVLGDGDLMELRFILRSEKIDGGQRLTIHRPLVKSQVTEAIYMLPGCDSQFFGGCAKYANQDNHGGAPYHPAYIDAVNTGFKTKTGK